MAEAAAKTTTPPERKLKRYEVTLEAQDGTGHYRTTRLSAPSADHARKACERKELEMVLWQIPDERIVDLIERKAADGMDVRLPKGTGPGGEVTTYDLHEALDQFPKPAELEHAAGDKATDEQLAEHAAAKRAFLDAVKQGDRAMLQAHYAEQPYKVVSVVELKDRSR